MGNTLINLELPVPMPQEVLKFYDRIAVYRTENYRVTPFVEITNPTTRIPIAEDRVKYDFADPAGDPSYYYTVAFVNSLTGQQSSAGDPIPATGTSSLDVISVQDLKTNYLFGLDLTIGTGEAFPDSLFEYYIRSAVAYVERMASIAIAQRVVVDEWHDYVRPNNPNQPLTFRTSLTPVQSVQAVRLAMPNYGSQPYSFPKAMIQCRGNLGRVTLMPTGAQAMQGIPFLPTVGLGFGAYAMDCVQNALRVDYVAGFAPGMVPFEILETVAKIATYGPLNIAGDLIGGAGIASQSFSIDGLSQSLNTTSSSLASGYGARLNNYAKEVAEQLPQIRRQYRGVQLMAI